jgi:hypothetical protein
MRTQKQGTSLVVSGDMVHEQCATCILLVLRWGTDVDLDMHLFQSASTSSPVFAPEGDATKSMGGSPSTTATRLFWNSKTYRDNPTSPIWGGVIYNMADDDGFGPESMGFSAGTEANKYHVVINPYAATARIPVGTTLSIYTVSGLSQTVQVPSTVTSSTNAWYVGYVDRSALAIDFKVTNEKSSRRRLTNGPARLDGPEGAAGYPNPAAS